MNFRVDLESFRGPLDLLLYLVRKHEIDIVDMPIALVTEQFCAHLDLLEKLDIDGIGEFLEMASTLIEIKSRLVLPHADEVEEPLDDPRQDLVRQLLEYKKFRDAASMLEDKCRTWQEHFGRLAIERPSPTDDLANEAIQEVELWDLVSAFARIVRDRKGPAQTNIVYDDTPIHVHMKRIAALLNEQGSVALGELFEPGMHKSKLVGMFLAVLELARHHSVKTEQSNLFGEIMVFPGTSGKVSVEDDAADEYDHQRTDDVRTTAVAEPAADTAHAQPAAPHFAAAAEPARTRKPRAKKPK
ncbi:MAG: segregation/condensation protein A [Planctomycetia bacterium]|nr:segregation/condensation protein A [Planctomycetia bacterium]